MKRKANSGRSDMQLTIYITSTQKQAKNRKLSTSQ